MADIPAYVVANFEVHDRDTYRQYEKGFFPIRFPSAEAAEAWYNDPDYQALSEHRRAGTRLEFLTMLHGLPPRD